MTGGYEAWLAARGYRRVTVQRSSFGECDSDRSGEAGETCSGSTVGESAGPKDIAQRRAA